MNLYFEISKKETIQIKALAILIIMLHNYFRWIQPITGENEFDFNSSRIKNFFSFIHNSPKDLIQFLSNYLGHYGVQVFIFLSVYGLVKIYSRKDYNWFSFVKERYIKLYPSFVIGIIFFMFYTYIVNGSYFTKKDVMLSILQLTSLNSFFPEKAFSLTGPWWFYSLIFQVYLVFPLFIFIQRKFNNYGLIGLGIIGYSLTFIFFPILLPYKINIFQTVFGHIPEIAFGIWMGLNSNKKVSWYVLVLAFIIFSLSNFNKFFWFFTHLSTGIIFLVLSLYIIRKTTRFSIIQNTLTFLGEISLYMFVIHGFIRYKFIGSAQYFNSTLAKNLNAVLFILVSICLSYILSKTENNYRNYVIEGNSLASKVFRTTYPIILLLILYVLLGFLKK